MTTCAPVSPSAGCPSSLSAGSLLSASGLRRLPRGFLPSGGFARLGSRGPLLPAGEDHGGDGYEDYQRQAHEERPRSFGSADAFLPAGVAVRIGQGATSFKVRPKLTHGLCSWIIRPPL